MPTWTPSPIWKGEYAYIIGGGPSLKGFDFGFLKDKNTIGCNDAFRLGPEVVDFCLFGDSTFFQRNKFELEKFEGYCVTCAPTLTQLNCPWLLQMTRIRDGLFDGPVLGWNYSTGAAAVNLAITLGAVRIFLLGFDMGSREGKHHWHPHTVKTVRDEAYKRFLNGFNTLSKHLPRFPHVRVFNVTDGASRLECFEKISFEQMFRHQDPPYVEQPKS